MQNARIVAVIIHTGGMLGIDEKYVAVPPDQFTCDPGRKTLQLRADKVKFEGAPALGVRQNSSFKP
jgi:hypothetical protein